MEKLLLLPFQCFNVWIYETEQLYSRRRWIHGFGHYCGNLPPDNSSGHSNDCRISADFVNKDTFKSLAGTVARDLLHNATHTEEEQQGALCLAKTPVPPLPPPSHTILTIRNLLQSRVQRTPRTLAAHVVSAIISRSNYRSTTVKKQFNIGDVRLKFWYFFHTATACKRAGRPGFTGGSALVRPQRIFFIGERRPSMLWIERLSDRYRNGKCTSVVFCLTIKNSSKHRIFSEKNIWQVIIMWRISESNKQFALTYTRSLRTPHVHI